MLLREGLGGFADVLGCTAQTAPPVSESKKVAGSGNQRKLVKI